ncbi:MAG: chemotaxis protein CheW [Spirochaetota bacterium]
MSNSIVDEENQYLTFRIGEELFAIPILEIREIKEYTAITSIPMMPNTIRGVINLRGNVVPVVDLAIRFRRQRKAVGKRTCIIILEVDLEEDSLDIGVIVDSVDQVVLISPTDIEPAPSFGSRIRLDFIKGIAKVEDKFIIVLNTVKVFSIEELSQLEEASEKDGVSAIDSK